MVVLPHWGTQYTHVARTHPARVGRALVALVRTWSWVVTRTGCRASTPSRGVPVLHSLGNFVFDMDFMEQTMEGVMLEATFWGAELKAVRLRALPDGPDDLRANAGSAVPLEPDPRRTCGRHSTGPYAARSTDRSLALAARARLSRGRARASATTVRAVRSSWARSTTAGTSPAEW